MKYLIITISFFILHTSYSQNSELVDYGNNLIYENKLDEAVIYFNEQVLEPNTKEENIHILLGLAEIYKLKLDYDTANQYYVEAFEAIKKSKNIQLEFYCHVKMAEFYRKRTLFVEAVKQLEKAALILKKNQVDDVYLAKFYSRKAALFTEYFIMPDSTLLYAQKALGLSKKLDDKIEIFYATLEISGVYESEEDYKKATDYLEDLIAYAEENNLIQNQVDAYINYTRVLIKDKQFSKALDECLKALDFAKKNDLFYGEILFVDNIRNIYKELGNITKAYEYLELRLKLTDKYYKIEHGKFLFELEEKYKLAEKENQIKINTLEIANQNKALASNKIKLYVSIGLFLTAIVLTLLITYLLRKTKQSNKELQSLSKENEFLLSEANHRINNNLQLVVILISDQLKKTTDQENFQLKNILTKVEAISTLHKHLYKNKDKRKVDAANYLNDVKVSFFEVFKENNIQTDFKIASVEISSDYAMYFGLLLTELCINSIKHAFDKKESKKITFRLEYANNTLYFNYSDTGSRLKNQEIKPKLIDKICRQLKITYQIKTENGFSFSFEKDITND